MARVLVTGMSGAGKTTLLDALAARGHPTVDTDHVYLHAPLDVLLQRLTSRTNNPYGSDPAHREEVARYVRDVEPLIRRSATCELDGTLPVQELADAVEALLRTGAATGLER